MRLNSPANSHCKQWTHNSTPMLKTPETLNLRTS
jgi:hypothetical protein